MEVFIAMWDSLVSNPFYFNLKAKDSLLRRRREDFQNVFIKTDEYQ